MATIEEMANALMLGKKSLMAAGVIAPMQMVNTQETKDPVKINYAGTTIMLPEINGRQMPIPEAIEALKRKMVEEESDVNIYHEIPGSPLDGAVAFHKALCQTFGWSESVVSQGFFGPRNETTMIGVPVSATESIQIPWGQMRVPGVEGVFATAMGDAPPRFMLKGTIKRKHEKQVNDVVVLAKKILAEQSIYKCSSVRVSFEYEREEKDYHPIANAPKFMTLDTTQELVFGDRVARELDIGLFTPIEHKEACRKYQIPLKRGVLLYGPYGVGKTLTANITAMKANRNGWTFVYLDDVRDLKRGLEFAARYAPAVLFAEDIDRMVNGERCSEMDEILNTLDGVDTKNGEIITVFTTNHVENINPAMLRMGRMDALVEILPPDAKAAGRLVTLYARGLLEEGASLDRISERLAGKIPAFIREVTERAKIAAISRLGGDIEGHVTEQDLLDSAGAMETHNNFLTPKETKATIPEYRIRVVQQAATTNGVGQAYQGLAQGIPVMEN